MLLKKCLSAFFLLCMIILTLPIFKASATSTIAVNPPTSNVTIGNVFNVTVDVTNIVNFTSWQLSIFYLNSVLKCNNVSEGPFLKSGAGPYGTFFIFNITNNYNSTYGRVLAACTLNGLNVSANGSGTLAIFTFQALAGGDTPLHLADVKLGDEKIPPQPIPYTVTDGIVHSAGPGAVHDVAVTNVTAYKRIIFQKFSSNFTVKVENHGGFLETFNVTLYALNATATTIIAKKSIVNMQTGISTMLNFTWDTTGFPMGNYTIKAVADIIQDETNINDNNFTDGWIMITIVGDITGAPGHSGWDFVPDGSVDGSDLIVIARCFGSYPGAPPPLNWNANCDITNDGSVDGSDIIIVARHFGEHA